MSTENVLTIPCPHCGAEPGADCHSPSGKVLPGGLGHKARLQGYRQQQFAARMEVAHAQEREQFKAIAKSKYKVRAPSYVWCDAHGEIHSADGDPYGDHPDDCKPHNWRRVYIGTDDKNETF